MQEIGSKRSNNNNTTYEVDGENNAQKKPRQEGEMKVRLLVLGRYAGSLIGKGGENFKRLRLEYPVRITGLSSQANERVLQLDGQVEHCVSIVRELIPLCPEARYGASTGKSEFELNLLSNTQVVGLLIGRGGSKMREVSDETGIRLKVYPDCLPNSNERVVSLGANDEDTIIQGLKKVLEILDGAPVRSATTYFNPDKNPPAVGSMDMIGRPQQNQNQRTGLLGQQTVAADALQGPSLSDSIDNVPGLLIAYRDMKKKAGFDPTADFGSLQTETTIKIPYGLSGAIIGKGGQNIRYMKSVSGATMDFSPAGSNDNERTITMTGTQDQIQIAEQLMAQCIRASKNLQQPQQEQQQEPQQLFQQQQPQQQFQPQQQSAGINPFLGQLASSFNQPIAVPWQ